VAAHCLWLLIKDAKGIESNVFINWYPVMISARSTICSLAKECQLLFGVDSHEESTVETHADMLVDKLPGANK
jgi:hypothetical protein